MTDVVAVLLVILAILDWGATVTLVRGALSVHEPALDERATASVILTIGATMAAILAVIVLLDLDAGDGIWLLLLTIGLGALSLPQVVWVVAYWRGQFQ